MSPDKVQRQRPLDGRRQWRNGYQRLPDRAAMASAARFSVKISTEIDTLSTITEQEESHTKGDDCERPEGRRMQYVSLAACYCNQASCALFFSAGRGLRVHPSEEAKVGQCGSTKSN